MIEDYTPRLSDSPFSSSNNGVFCISPCHPRRYKCDLSAGTCNLQTPRIVLISASTGLSNATLPTSDRSTRAASHVCCNDDDDASKGHTEKECRVHTPVQAPFNLAKDDGQTSCLTTLNYPFVYPENIASFQRSWEKNPLYL